MKDLLKMRWLCQRYIDETAAIAVDNSVEDRGKIC